MAEFTITDFLIGFFLMNAMPHFIFGITKTRMLSLFGYSAAGNIGYALAQITAALIIFHIQYGINELLASGIFLGALTIMVIYLISGKLFVNAFRKK